LNAKTIYKNLDRMLFLLIHESILGASFLDLISKGLPSHPIFQNLRISEDG
jgi:hypothetical protein